MRTVLVRLAAATAVLAAALPAGAAVPGAPDCQLFPADNAWHADVSRLPVHSRSAAWLTSMGGPGRRLHPDFGPAGPGEQPYGIPYVVVDGSKPKVPVSFDYDDESDAGPYPFGPDTPVESGSDRHALMVDRTTCTLYELYAVEWNDGSHRPARAPSGTSAPTPCGRRAGPPPTPPACPSSPASCAGTRWPPATSITPSA